MNVGDLYNLMYKYNFRKRDLKENYFEIGINYVRENKI